LVEILVIRIDQSINEGGHIHVSDLMFRILVKKKDARLQRSTPRSLVLWLYMYN